MSTVRYFTPVLLILFAIACSDDNGVVPDTGTADGPPVQTDGGDDGPTSDGPTSDGPTTDGPADDGPADDGPAGDGPLTDGPGPLFDAPAFDGPVGKLCGPIPGGTCGKSEVCNISGCAIGSTGVCVKKPAACAKIYMPVCGCDDITYSNDCFRLQAGVALKHTGACKVVPVDAGPMLDNGVATKCGPFPGGLCPKGFVCNILSCALGATGTCAQILLGCPKILAPVCGCDGVTYSNDCFRIQAGAALDYKGACVIVPPADASVGMKCGGLLGAICKKGYVCDIQSCAKSASGVCVVQPTICPFLWAPVCGCDNLTYSNDCVRLMAGARLKHQGSCKLIALDGGSIKFDL